MTNFDGVLRGRDPDSLDRVERRELLSAYMDDELPADEARIVTAWLDENPAVLIDIERIRRTWDLLDHYEDEPVPARFAAGVFDAAGVARGHRVEMAWYRRPAAWAAIAAAVLIAFGVGLFVPGDNDVAQPTDRTALLDTVPDELLEDIDLLVELDADTFEAVLLADYEAIGDGR